MPKRTAFILIALLTSGAAVAEDDNVWQFALPTTKAIVGVNWRRIADSPLARSLKQELADQHLPVDRFASFLHGVDEILVASPGKQADDAEDKQPPILIRLSGRFQAEEVQKLFGGKGSRVQTYNSRRIYRQTSDGDMAATLLDAHTILMGDSESLFAALTRLEWPAKPAGGLFERAAKLRNEYDFWALFATTPAALTGPNMPNLPFLDDLRGMELALGLHDGLDLHIALETDSDASAAKLAANLHKMLKLVEKQKQKGANPQQMVQLTEAAKKIQISPDQTRVQLALRLSADELERSIKEAAARRRMKPPSDAVAVTMKPSAPPPPERRTIRIEGLDDGPREIRMPGQ